MEATTYPSLILPPEPPASRLERIGMWIPILGWIITSQLYYARHKPRKNQVRAQLAARVNPHWERWGDAPRQAVARIVCAELQKEFRWPNPHFLPEDALGILGMPGDFDCEWYAALLEIEIQLGLGKKPPYDTLFARDSKDSHTTLAQLVDILCAAQAKLQPSPQPL